MTPSHKVPVKAECCLCKCMDHENHGVINGEILVCFKSDVSRIFEEIGLAGLKCGYFYWRS